MPTSSPPTTAARFASGPPPTVARFAPSPTGYLHLGHAYSALFAARAAAKGGGRFLLRIDDIDTARCRPEFEAAIYEDLAWLGLAWEAPVRRQSEHLDDYAAALARLDARGVLYPCFSTRKEIAAEVARMQSAPHGPDGPLYPGTCRGMSAAERAERIAAGRPYAMRLDVAAALRQSPRLTWHDRGGGTRQARPELLGDVMVARKETAASYHLSVVVDDHRQGVTLVTRGDDLFAASHLHRLLQGLLDYDAPAYHHHRLLTDDDGERLAKRADAVAIRAFRAAGQSPAAVRALAWRGAARSNSRISATDAPGPPSP